MAKDKTNKNISEVEKSMDLPPDVIKEIIQGQQSFIDDVFAYEICEALDEFSSPLTLKEKRALKKYNLENVDNEKNFDELMLDIAKLRGISDDVLEDQEYGELAIWVRQVCYGTFFLRNVVKK